MKRTSLLAGIALLLAAMGLTGCGSDGNTLEGQWFGFAHFPLSNQVLDVGRFEVNQHGRLTRLEVGGFLVPGVNLGTALIDENTEGSLYSMGAEDDDRDYLVLSSDQTYAMWVHFSVSEASLMIASMYRGTKPDAWPPTEDYDGSALAGDATEIPLAITSSGKAALAVGGGTLTLGGDDAYNLTLDGTIYAGTLDGQTLSNAGAGSPQSLNANFTNSEDFIIGETTYTTTLVGAPFLKAYALGLCLGTCQVSGTDYSAFRPSLFVLP